MRCTVLGPLALALSAAITSPATAQSPDDFYRGKRIDLVVGGNAGGVYDVVARSLARHIPSHIPGAPNMVVQNMPGAGSIKAAEWAATLAPRDGTALVALFPGALVQPLLESDRKFRFQARELGWIGSADSGARMCVTYHTAKRDLRAADGPATIIGASAAGGSTWDYAWLMHNLSTAKIKVVPGYKGTPDLAIAMERGEIDGVCGNGLAALRAEKPDWFRDGKLNFLVQFSTAPDPELTRLGATPIWDITPNSAHGAIELVLAQQAFARPYATPPGVPTERLALLRRAFDAALASDEMKGEFDRMGAPLSPINGENLDSLVKEIYDAPLATVEAARKALLPPG